MKICVRCGQLVTEKVNACPTCGAAVTGGLTAIDEFTILEVLHEGYSSTLCKALGPGDTSPVLIRIFTPPAGVDQSMAERLKHELEKLQSLPDDFFVRHMAIRQSENGLWYRISEWVETIKWGSLLSSGRLKDQRVCLPLLYQIASILDGLHRIGHIMPHLNLDDILVFEEPPGRLKVKIDFKLSRFLDPRLDRPRPLLARLMAMHPDILNHQPLDRRSDIWSLGKTFVEILGADPDATDLQSRVQTLPVSARVRTLIHLMLMENPEMRPDSMAEVAEGLYRAEKEAIQTAAPQADEKQPAESRRLLRRMNIRMAILAAMVASIIAAAAIAWYYPGLVRPGSETALMDYANRYARSVAFVVVDYWLQQGHRRIYNNRSEGTAFLADDSGLLLTNRHVSCPWLEDERLTSIINMLQKESEPLSFDYRIYLWFDGQRAFSRLPGLSSDALEDFYITDSGFSSQGPRRVWIAGVAPVPVKTSERVNAPLGDDFAVLKIDVVPPGVKALPLARALNARAIAKLTPLITLGFPLGSQTQASTINVSVTRGHVRRTFENMFQVDVSLHPGNSGGPFVDNRGRVVGLAANVAVGYSSGPFPTATPLSDIGMVLPITKASLFLEEIKAGRPKWQGQIDVSLEQRLEGIKIAARGRQWQQALDLADKAYAATRTPPLAMAAAAMHLCNADYTGARTLLNQALEIDPQIHMAHLMTLIIDRLQGRDFASEHCGPLAALDWRSPDEFLGYLAAILADEIDWQKPFAGGYTNEEKSWLHLIAGLVALSHNRLEQAWPLFETAALTADSNQWNLYLSLRLLELSQGRLAAQAPHPATEAEYSNRLERLEQRLEEAVAPQRARNEKLAAIKSDLRDATDLSAVRSLLEEVYALNPGNHDVLVAQAFYAAMEEDWDAALAYSRRFNALPGRINGDKLCLGLLESEIIHLLGGDRTARQKLTAYRRNITDPWYRTLSGYLLDPSMEADLTAGINENAENLLTGHAALGLWAEGLHNSDDAIKHYREALSSYLDQRIEYDFALVRLKRLRHKANE